MNRQWMRERLESFKALCERYQDESRRTADYTDTMRAISDQMAYEIPTVREILKRLDPTLVQEEPLHLGGASNSLRAVKQGLGILRDQDEWAANLAPDAPSFTADQFHPHVWQAASALWDTGQYRVAVGQAAVSLSAHIAKKAGSSLTERELVAQVFSPHQPGPNQVRLHLRGDKSSRTWKSRQEGLAPPPCAGRLCWDQERGHARRGRVVRAGRVGAPCRAVRGGQMGRRDRGRHRPVGLRQRVVIAPWMHPRPRDLSMPTSRSSRPSIVVA